MRQVEQLGGKDSLKAAAGMAMSIPKTTSPEIWPRLDPIALPSLRLKGG